MTKDVEIVNIPRDILTGEQRCRVECLTAARQLVNRNAFGAGGGTTELVTLARYIETGEVK